MIATLNDLAKIATTAYIKYTAAIRRNPEDTNAYSKGEDYISDLYFNNELDDYERRQVLRMYNGLVKKGI
jgi:hypothetical protein